LLIGSLYLALFIFVVVVLGAVALIARVPIKQFLKAVREPFVIAFATTSSESALPKAMEVMERLGVPPRIVGFVMPTVTASTSMGRHCTWRWLLCLLPRQLKVRRDSTWDLASSWS
jgi:Na+/H+-dicarboxylate symporters